MGKTELTEKFDRRDNLRGTALTIMGGIFWGLAGVFGKYSFVYRGMTAQWLVNVRLIIAGIILLTAVYRKQGKDTWRVWKNKRHAIRMILYGVIGIAACQMTYYMAVDDSNAGIATVLQYTAPVMIMIYLAIRNRKMPNCTELTALFLAFAGTVLLATHGNLTELSISKITLVLGLLSAVATVFYNLLPGELMNEYGTFEIVGWAMLVSGILLLPVVRPWTIQGIIWDWQTVLCVGVVIIIGTVLSFGCYMEGVRLIGGTKASLFASIEPLTATVISILFMGVAFSWMDLFGFVGIIGAVTILSLPKKKA